MHLFLDPCEGGKTCGECAGCRVANHAAQCSCPPNYYGDPMKSCTKNMMLCDSTCECDEIGYCIKSCQSNDDCSCGEMCYNGKCRLKCDYKNKCAEVKNKYNCFQYNLLCNVLYKITII